MAPSSLPHTAPGPQWHPPPSPTPPQAAHHAASTSRCTWRGSMPRPLAYDAAAHSVSDGSSCARGSQELSLEVPYRSSTAS
jgi:hypothetical protein